MRGITEGLRFDAFHQREAAVTDAIMQTYAWIYQRNPAKEPLAHSTPGVLKWASFPGWLENPSETTYWITGKPGSGKSTIMKYILNSPALQSHIRAWAGGEPVIVINYYAWNAGTTRKNRLTVSSAPCCVKPWSRPQSCCLYWLHGAGE